MEPIKHLITEVIKFVFYKDASDLIKTVCNLQCTQPPKWRSYIYFSDVEQFKTWR